MSDGKARADHDAEMAERARRAEPANVIATLKEHRAELIDTGTRACLDPLRHLGELRATILRIQKEM